jgi:hypothetical protein
MQRKDEGGLAECRKASVFTFLLKHVTTHRYFLPWSSVSYLERNSTIQMADHPLPEMLRLSLSDLALRIKIMKVKIGSSIEDVLSRALDPPVAINVQRAISMLVEV